MVNSTQPQSPPPASPRRRRVGRLLAFLVLVLLLAAGWRWGLEPRLASQAQPQAPGTQPIAASTAAGSRGRFQMAAPQPVGAATIGMGDIDITLNALGAVTPLATVTVQTQINGQLMAVGFKEGQVIEKGGFLAQIDPRPYEVALEQAQATLQRDQALLQGAKVDLARYQKLAKQNSIAQQQADDQLFLVKQYEGTVRLDQAAIDSAKLNLVYCHITSPVPGKAKAGLRLIDVGNYVQTTSTTGIVVLTQLEPIDVVFPVAEDFLPQIQKRIATGAKLPVTAYDRSSTIKLGEGTLFAVDSQIDPTTGTVRLKAEFENDDLALFPQQFVNAQLLVDTLKDVVIAPTAAIQRGAPGTFVFKIQPNNKVAVTRVRLGPVQGERVAVLSGLSVGDRVVVDGADRLRDGSEVTIPQANARPGASGRGRRRAAAGGVGQASVGVRAGGTAKPSAAEAEGSNAGPNSPLKGKKPPASDSKGPGYNPPPDTLTAPTTPSKRDGP
jgi:membrane fusion protein, multidrug efflux system